MFSKRSLSFGVLLAHMIPVSTAGAAVIFVDDFTGAGATPLSGKSPVIGANWVVQNSGLAQISTPGLTYQDAGYTGLIANGNAARVNQAGSIAGSTIASAPLGSARSVLYTSFLFKREDANSYFSYALSSGAGSTYVAGIYLRNDGIVGAAGFNDPDDTYPEQLTAQSISIGDTALIMMRYTFDAGAPETMSVAINPVLGMEPVWQASTSFSFDTQPDFAGFYTGSTGSTTYFDEIRIGTTFMDVAPVPEPSSISLLALGLAGFMRRRRSAASHIPQ